ncbi:MAG TPA: GDP-mannose 4,6-dehydratase [Chloroflexia bacterium]|nr:GDP-mannose 4,6-dehydratase [Chloroflexia bacterium]
MRVLITGITGFAGSHMAEMLFPQKDIEVFGTYRRRSRLDNVETLLPHLNLIEVGVSSIKTIRDSFIPGKINMVNTDLVDAFSVHKLIGAVQPDRIFHLAAQSFVPTSWNAPAETLQTNVMGQLNLFEAVRENNAQLASHGEPLLDPLIQIAGSSEEYGLVHSHEVPMTEQNPLRPLSPYAVSKVTQEKLAYQYWMSYGLKSIVSRGFNHDGPRRGEHFAPSTWARQIARIEKGLQDPVVYVGDLTSQRDITDVRDMVRAYWLMLEHGEPGEVYNIGSGKTRPMGEMLDMLLAMSNVRIEVKQDPARLRPSDVMILWADASKFQQATGWEPTIPFEQTLKDLLAYWRAHV